VRILVVANSQGTDAGLQPGRSYPRLLAAAVAPRHEVVDWSRSGWDVERFVEELPVLRAEDADVVVVQVGIVECVQRILSTGEKRFFRVVPLGDRFTKLLHDRRPAVVRLRRRLGIPARLYSTERFAAAVAALERGLAEAGTRVVLLEIPRLPDAHAARWFPFANDDIERFNAVLRSLGAVPFVDAAHDASLWQPATVHLSDAGHAAAAARLQRLVC
jgi:hypothetical protein